MKKKPKAIVWRGIELKWISSRWWSGYRARGRLWSISLSKLDHGWYSQVSFRDGGAMGVGLHKRSAAGSVEQAFREYSKRIKPYVDARDDILRRFSE